MSGPPFGACLPVRKSFARPAVGTRRRTRNAAGFCVVMDTAADFPLGTVSSKKSLPVAPSAAGARRRPRASVATASRTAGWYASPPAETRRLAGPARDHSDPPADVDDVHRRPVVRRDRRLGEDVDRWAVGDDAALVE